MKRGTDKIRLLAVMSILMRGQKITTKSILRELDLKYDIQADRKTIYSDIYSINRFIPIESTCGVNGGHQRINVLERCDQR